MMKFLGKISFLIISVLLVGCGASKLDRKNQYTYSSPPQGFEVKLVAAGDFVLTTYQKITSLKDPYIFYIEGDGNIANRNMVSYEPTPRQTTLIDLMLLDERPNVVYVARPCQYTPKEYNKACYNRSYWTKKRFAPEVVSSVKDVVNKIAGGRKTQLVGYSGGGGIAVLIAKYGVRNLDNITTIAANLDIEEFVNYHKSLPMSESINPIKYAQDINHISQLHLSGELDPVVPSFIAQKYVEYSNSAKVKYQIIPNASHSKGWEEFWYNYVNIKNRT